MMANAVSQQIAAQCRVVAHLAASIADVHRDLERIYLTSPKAAEDIASIAGPRSARLMEQLGDILNGMDACDEDDEWTAPIFAEAQRLYPAASHGGKEG